MSNQRGEDMARVEAAINTLAEHFDAVQIFATRCEQGELQGTINVDLGIGNWFARYGHVTAWIKRHDGNEAAYLLKKDGEAE